MKYVTAAFACLLAMPSFAAAPSALNAAGTQVLVAAPVKGVRLLALWSLDCAYCEENLSALAAFQRSHADVELVFVATDPISESPALEARLKAAGLDAVPSRAYADATPERINFLIDPTWGGETPRTLAIKADGTRKGVSGALDAGRIARLVD
ncbi:hypothetical protein QFZ41_000880 [Luteibacter sp. W1I16]|uniref:hypothetical protein n=1 Tax=Luteibacter sp. W1I16 TaxID=3373922 RepID=UPI003D25ADDF